jgi:hypothetical protein
MVSSPSWWVTASRRRVGRSTSAGRVYQSRRSRRRRKRRLGGMQTLDCYILDLCHEHQCSRLLMDLRTSRAATPLTTVLRENCASTWLGQGGSCYERRDDCIEVGELNEVGVESTYSVFDEHPCPPCSLTQFASRGTDICLFDWG